MRISNIVERVALNQPLGSSERAALLLLLDLRFTGVQKLDQVLINTAAEGLKTSAGPVIQCTSSAHCTFTFPPLEPEWVVGLPASDCGSDDDVTDDSDSDSSDESDEEGGSDADSTADDDEDDSSASEDSSAVGKNGNVRLPRAIPLRDVRLPTVRVSLLPDTSASIIAAGKSAISRHVFNRALTLVRAQTSGLSYTSSLAALRRALEREPVA